MLYEVITDVERCRLQRGCDEHRLFRIIGNIHRAHHLFQLHIAELVKGVNGRNQLFLIQFAHFLVLYRTFCTDTGLSTNILCFISFLLTCSIVAFVGDREEPDTDERHTDREECSIFIRENCFSIAKNLYPYDWTEA